jgi:hypothetical protein
MRLRLVNTVSRAISSGRYSSIRATRSAMESGETTPQRLVGAGADDAGGDGRRPGMSLHESIAGDGETGIDTQYEHVFYELRLRR